MSTKRSPSWASVVAHGIDDAAMETKDHAQTLPSKKCVTISLAVASSKIPMLLGSPSSTTPSSSPPTTYSSVLKRPAMTAKDLQLHKKEQLVIAGNSKASYTLSQDIQSGSDARRPLRNIWPRHPNPLLDLRQHHKTNSQGCVYRQSYGITHMHPRSPASANVPRPVAMTAKHQPKDGSDQESVSAGAPICNTHEFQLPKKAWLPTNEDFPERQRVCVSPRARTRCQINWQPICKSRQVWRPRDPNGRGFDPSNPMPKPPPGFENITPGKQAISSRARELMGVNVKMEARCDYPMAKTMPTPERELREQQHFIAKHDTHLTCRQVQLRVTNGGTEDGYYVRPLVKLLSKLTKPKYKSSLQPNVSYSELLRRNHEKDKAETMSKNRKMTNISNSLISKLAEKSPNHTDPITDKNSTN